jgi:hypothetical protein
MSEAHEGPPSFSISLPTPRQERPPASFSRALPRLRGGLRWQVCRRLRSLPPALDLSFGEILRCLRRLGERHCPYPLRRLRLRLFQALLVQVLNGWRSGRGRSNGKKKAWAGLLAKIYEVNPFLCPECGGKMAVIAVIQGSVEIRGIIACLAGKGRGPPQ